METAHNAEERFEIAPELRSAKSPMKLYRRSEGALSNEDLPNALRFHHWLPETGNSQRGMV